VADHDREAELAAGLQRTHDRIAAAAAAAGRDAGDITVVIVTKTWPASDVRLLHGLGVRDVGENRHPEAEHKAAELDDLDLTWHFIGQIQSNKAPRIARYANVVHSVDSARLAHRLNAGAHQGDRTLDCLVQVTLDPEDGREHRGGVSGAGIEEVAAAIDSAGALRLSGVMGVAPLGGDAVAAYTVLAGIAEQLRAVYPGARTLSAGMSDDFEAAISAGATHVRVGSAVLGRRPPLG
jgi:pyridoxal phosphate enzyme (YggS family)